MYMPNTICEPLSWCYRFNFSLLHRDNPFKMNILYFYPILLFFLRCTIRIKSHWISTFTCRTAKNATKNVNQTFKNMANIVIYCLLRTSCNQTSEFHTWALNRQKSYIWQKYLQTLRQTNRYDFLLLVKI